MRKSKIALSVALGLSALVSASVIAETAKNDTAAPAKKDWGSRFYEKSNNAAPPSEYSLKGKPNIIVFVLDDLGYGQVDYDENAFNKDYLSKMEIPKRYQAPVDKAIEAAKKSTPTIRSLADNGVRLKQGFVAHGVSGPSRAAIMTGRLPARFGIYSNNDVAQGVPTSEKFLAEELRNHGYYTAAIGKWHMCRNARVAVPEEKRTRDYHDNATIYCNEPFQPQNRGFDYFFGFHASGAAYYNSPSLFRNRERAEPEGYLTEQITNEAITQLEKAHRDNEPAFLYVAYNAPHIPLQHDAPKEYQIFNTGNHQVDNYYAYVYAADQGIKRILEQLKKEGELDNTLIFFTSDNGSVIDAPLPMNGVFKGFKGETYQGGVHVPLIVSWPKGIKAGENYDKLVSTTDILPTALAAAGIKIPADEAARLDGINLLPYLDGEKKGEVPHQYLYWVQPLAYHWDTINIPFWEGYDDFIDGNRDAPPNNPNLEKDSKFTWTVRDNDWTLHYYAGDNTYRLYKNTDTAETDNLYSKEPKVAARLKAAIHDYLINSAMPLTDNNVPKYKQLLESTE